jgi:hypothetical protein
LATTFPTEQIASNVSRLGHAEEEGDTKRKKENPPHRGVANSDPSSLQNVKKNNKKQTSYS